MAQNLYSIVKYLGAQAPGETRFNIPFPFLRSSDISVFKQDETVDPATTTTLFRGVDWDYYDSTTVELTTGVLDGESITIRRFTEKAQRLSNFSDGSGLTEEDLNDVTRQLLYLIQELKDGAFIADNDIPGGTGDTSQEDIDQNIIDVLNNSQLFNDLTTLIDLVDINAENTISNILNNYDEWSLGHERLRMQHLMSEYLTGEPATVTGWTNIVNNEDGNLAQRVTLTESNTGSNLAYIGDVDTAFTTEKSATATRFSEVGARIDTEIGIVEGQISDLDTIVANEKVATAERFSLIGTNFDGNTATIADLRQATSTQNSVVALMVKEMVTELDFDDTMARSVYLEGIETLVEDAGPDGIVSITEAITTQISQVDSNIAAVDNKVETNATEMKANTSVLQEMASTYGGLNVDGTVDPVAFTAAITNEWETFASGEAESASASAVSTLEANTIPILFATVPPDHSAAPYNEGAFADTGFKTGTVWFMTISNTNTETMRQFVFHRGVASGELDEIPGVSSADVGERVFFIGNNTLGNGYGAWIEQTATALGALLKESGQVDVSADGVLAQLTSLTEGVYEGRVSAVEQTQEVFLGPDGYANSQWDVRMNQFASDGSPVVAGFGLGLETDPNNPNRDSVSNFIVMADNFLVVKPPTDIYGDPDPLDGSNWEESSAIVPFSVDGQTGYVRINGNLFIDDTLYAYEGRMKQLNLGKAVFGQMNFQGNFVDSYWGNQVDENGFRMELLSSTEGFWSSVDRDYLIWAGTGARRDNNAVFWLDKNGNAFFGGQVQAEGISGSMAATKFISVSTGHPNASSGTYAPATALGATPNWVQVGSDQIFDIDSQRLLRPVVQVAIDLLWGKSGAAKLEIAYEQTPGGNDYTGWINVHEAAFVMYGVPNDQGQTQLTLQGIPKDASGKEINTRAKVKIRVMIAGKFGNDFYSSGYKGLAMALPTSSTPALGPDSTTSDSGDVGEPISLTMDDITFGDEPTDPT